MKLLMRSFLIILLLLSNYGFAQELHLYSDYIADEQGNRLQGIKVQVVGRNFDITNFNGEFTVKAKYGDEIVLSKDKKRMDSYIYDGSLKYTVSHFKSNKKKSKPTFKRVLDSARYYSKRKPVKSIQFVEQALKITNNTKKKAKAYEVLADAFYQLKQYDLAENNYEITYKTATSITLQLKLAKTYYKNSKYGKSKKLYEKILKNKRITPYQKINILEGLASLAKRTGEHKKSITNLESALLISEKNAISTKTTQLNTKLAEANSLQGNIDKSNFYISNSISSAKKESKQKVISQTNRVADFYGAQNEISQEIVYRKKTLKKLEEENVFEMEVSKEDYISKPKVKYDIGKALVKQQKYKEAITYFSESATEANSTKDIETEKDAVQGLSEVYATLGDDKKAIINYNRLAKLVDFSFQKKEKEIAQAAAISKDIANKQNRILSLETNKALNASKYELTTANNKRQKLIIYSLLSGLVLLLLSLFYMLKSNKQRKLTNNLLALKSLRSQMNPHFIFNALNSVNNFISSNDERSANRYLTDFSTLMRSVLENSEQDFIPLEKEIELLNLYLKLEHARFKDKFEYTLQTSQNIDVSAFQIPPMLLQPYVENAVWHGLRYKKEKGLLQIDLTTLDKETIQITISDNGIGREKSKALKSKNQLKRKSKGMQNIHERIAILNEMYPNKIAVSITDLKEDATGTKVVLTLKKTT